MALLAPSVNAQLVEPWLSNCASAWEFALIATSPLTVVLNPFRSSLALALPLAAAGRKIMSPALGPLGIWLAAPIFTSTFTATPGLPPMIMPPCQLLVLTRLVFDKTAV